MLPSVSYLANSDVQAAVLKEVAAQYRPSQLEMEGVTAKPDIAAIVARTSELVIQQTIDIPRILVVPTGKVQSGFNPFTLKLDTLELSTGLGGALGQAPAHRSGGCDRHGQGRHSGIAAGGLRRERPR